MSAAEPNFIDPTKSPGLDMLFCKFDQRVISATKRDNTEELKDS